jgi:single-strand DNA-binding protein
MPSLNKITIIGHLGKDPVTRTTSTDKTVASFSVACSEKYNGVESTEWFNVIAWEKLAGIAATYLKKGKLVYIEGRLKSREYETNGEKRKITEIIANNILMLGGKGEKPAEPIDDDPY